MRESKHQKIRKSLLICFLAYSFVPTALEAGLLISGGLAWSAFSFQPESDEITKNYYSISPELIVGYSFGQKFDLALSTHYSPGHLGRANIGKEHASLQFMGLQCGIRLKNSVFLGLKSGQSSYQLLSYEKNTDQIRGAWKGLSSGLIIGSISKINKTNYWQVSLELLHSSLEPEDSTALSNNSKIKKLDQFRLSLTYTFNSFIKSLRSKFRHLF